MNKNLVLLLSVLVFTFLAMEITLRIFYPQNFGYYAKRDGIGLNILRENMIYYHRINERNVTYKFGKFNNRETHLNLDYNKDKILILGDSFTFGWLIEDKNTFVGLLQSHFKDFYFINPSVPGWGTSSQVMYVENYCKKIKPKKIIIIINTDDIGRAWWSTLYKYKINDLNEIKNNELNIGYREPLNYDSKDYQIPFFKFIAKNSHTYVLIRQIYMDFKNRRKNSISLNTSNNFPIPENRSELVKDKYLEVNMLGKMLFLRLKKLSENCGAELLVIYTGWYDYETRKDKNGSLYFLENAELFFKDKNIRYYDLTNQMKEVHSNFNDYIIKKDHHPNEKGHKIIFNKIIQFVKLN